MILRSIRVRKYKNILDSGEMEIRPDVTCLVGKNESGKSALLQALYRLNPVPTGHPEQFASLRDYPRREYVRDRRRINRTAPITATFELEDADVRAVEAVHGPGALSSRLVTVARSYRNELVFESGIAVGSSGAPEPFPVPAMVPAGWPEGGEGRDQGRVEPEGGDRGRVARSDEEYDREYEARYGEGGDEGGGGGDEGTDESWEERLTALGFDDEEEEGASPEPEGFGFFPDPLEEEDPPPDVGSILAERLPRFFYFDDCSMMPGRLSVPQLRQADELASGERSALSLIRLSGIDVADFTREEYEARRASLEAAAGDLTKEVFEYWSQNRDLSVEFDVDFDSADGNGGDAGPFIELRIRNHRHGVTLNFADRSQGFTWFFSLLASLSQLPGSRRLILLLDEPGSSLHASAQHDLLRFIDERLTPTHQVLYSTHSPFMIDSKHLERVRTVEEREGEGSRVSDEPFEHSRETRLPIEAALGQELIGSLVGERRGSLFVKEPSDHVYLSALSAHLESLGRTSLDSRWSIVPVGGMSGLSAFAALSGSGMRRVAVLFDGPEGEEERPGAQSPLGKRLLANRGIIRIADFAPPPPAEAEREEESEDLELSRDLEELAEATGETLVTADPDGDDLVDLSPFAAALAARVDTPLEERLAEAVEDFPEVAEPGDGTEYGDVVEPPGAGPGRERGDEGHRDASGGETPQADGKHEPGFELEDLLAEDFFLDLVNRSGAATVEPFEVRGAGSIVRRIEAATGVGLDRLRPARLLLDREIDPLRRVDDPTLERFESLFKKINQLLT